MTRKKTQNKNFVLTYLWWRLWCGLVDLRGLAVQSPAAHYHIVVPGEGVHILEVSLLPIA